jgi:hypothetical protein
MNISCVTGEKYSKISLTVFLLSTHPFFRINYPNKAVVVKVSTYKSYVLE